MTMSSESKQPSSRSSLCCTTPKAICFWFAAFLVFYGTGMLLRELLPVLRPHQMPVLLGAAGLACLANFARNRTLHCAITGPLFILAAGYAAARITRGSDWSTPSLWAVVLIVVGGAMLLEQYYGRRSSPP